MPNNEIKPWIIEISYANCRESYGAYSKENPLENDKIPEDFMMQAEDNLWNNYGWTVTGWNCEDIDEDYEDDPVAWQNEYDQIREEFMCNIDWSCYIDEDYEIEGLEIVYDERNS